MRRQAIGLVGVVGVLVAAAGWTAADAPKPDEKKALTKKDVETMMVKTHKGKDAPLVRTAAGLKKDALDWDVLAKDARAFSDMAAMMKVVRFDYTSPKGYIDHAAAFEAAVKEKDRKATDKAFAGLTKSCSSCHYHYPNFERLAK